MEIGTWLDPLLSPAQWHGMAQARTLFGKITFWPSVAYLCVAKVLQNLDTLAPLS